jgi:propanol-preferring alcohol dehydrogenase
MRTMIFDEVGQPLRAVERPIPKAGPGQLLVRVQACGVCRTDLHLLDGEVEIAAPPRILGHQIVGTVVADAHASASRQGDREEPRIGVPWLGWTDGDCPYCTSQHENLCPNARFTGCDIDGGYAEYAVADERYCFAIPSSYTSSTRRHCCAPG